MKRVLVTEPIHEDGINLLSAREDVEVICADDADPATLARLIPGVHGIAVRTAKMSADLLSLSKELQVVSRHGVGCDNVDVAHLSQRRIPVAIAAGANSTSVAELTLAMMLTLTRRLRDLDQAVRANNFGARSKLLSLELEGANLLIVGFGRIGKKVAARARAFGMNVTIADIALDQALANELGCKAVEDFRPELPNADILSVHVPLDDSTLHLVSDEVLSQLKPGAVLLNCARGGVVDEAALLKVLENGRLAGAGLDVFSTEPPPADDPIFGPLLAREDVVLAPHAGAASTGAMRAMAMMAAQNILDCFDGVLKPDCTFNLEALEPR